MEHSKCLEAKHISKDRLDTFVFSHTHLGWTSPSGTLKIMRDWPASVHMFTMAFEIQVRIGRIAGQYAKPRSSRTEIIDGREVLSFRCAMTLNSYIDPDVI
jgi:hypothetical protein